jgi:peptidoglycan/LPS O-acetylase OafA/YrhL
MVVVYHLWPDRLPGGFVGVDVFFVISGYLIIAHLLAHPPMGMRDVVVFWGRRIRRLLPVAFFVIVVALGLVLLIEPMTQWRTNASAAIGAGIYLENWSLAGQLVDYLARAGSPTAFQHFWSLSVEEQFYLIWPVLIGLAVWLGGLRASSRAGYRERRFRVVAAVVIGLVVVVSLGYSILATAVAPQQAYFITPTRMWELAAGGVVAVAYPALTRMISPSLWTRRVLVVAGLVVISASGILLTGQGFPGWVALLPVVGAVLVLASGSGVVGSAHPDGPAHQWWLDRALGVRPIQFLGDISYSVYLWHWVFIAVLPWATGHPLTWPEKLGVIAATILASWASKRQIEDRFRGTKPLGAPLWRTFVFLVVGMAVVVSAGVGVYVVTGLVAHADDPIVVPADATCVGAAARLDPACTSGDPHGTTVFGSPLQASADRNTAYADGCWWTSNDPQRFPICQYSATSADQTVGLFGNSHAGPYLTPLQEMAADSRWNIRTYLASSCYPSREPLAFETAAARQGCLDFTTQAVADMVASGVDVVVMSALTQPATDPTLALDGVAAADLQARQQASFAGVLAQLTDAGIRVVVVRDVPMPPDSVVDCLAQNMDKIASCDGPRDARVAPDPLFDAASAMGDPLVTPLDLNDALCDATTCWDVVGAVVVYFNQGHLTATFASTLRPYLEPVIAGRG